MWCPRTRGFQGFFTRLLRNSTQSAQPASPFPSTGRRTRANGDRAPQKRGYPPPRNGESAERARAGSGGVRDRSRAARKHFEASDFWQRVVFTIQYFQHAGANPRIGGSRRESSKRACWRRRSPLRRSDPPSRAPRGELHAGFWRGTLLGRAPARGCELRAPPPVQRPRACEGRHGRGGRG